MIEIVPQKTHIRSDGTITALQKNLTKIASNAAVDQLCSKVRANLGSLDCDTHPGFVGNMITISVPGGDVTKQNSFNFSFTGFCCDQFQDLARERLYDQFRTEEDSPESSE